MQDIQVTLKRVLVELEALKGEESSARRSSTKEPEGSKEAVALGNMPARYPSNISLGGQRRASATNIPASSGLSGALKKLNVNSNSLASMLPGANMQTSSASSP